MATRLKTVSGLAQEGSSTLWKRTAWAPGSYWEDMVSPNMRGSSGSPLLEEHLPQSSYYTATRNCTIPHRTQLPSPLERPQAAPMSCLPTCARALFTPSPHLTENLHCRTEKKQPLLQVTVIFAKTMTSAQVTSQENYVLWCKNVSWASPKKRNQLGELIWSFVRISSEYAQEYQHAANPERGETPGVCPFLAHEWSDKTEPTNTKPQINVYHYFLLYAMLLEKSYWQLSRKVM